MSLKKELISAIKNSETYDFIANNYFEFSQLDLVGILKECIFILETKPDCKQYLSELAENIDDYLDI